MACVVNKAVKIKTEGDIIAHKIKQGGLKINPTCYNLRIKNNQWQG